MAFDKLRKHFGTDQAKERDGAWQTYPGTDIEARIRRSTHPEFTKALRKHFKKIRHLPAEAITPEMEKDIKMKAAAEALVVDWKIGEDMPCNAESVLSAFKEMPDFYAWVESEADNFENYRLLEVEADAAPLSPSSNGSTSGESPTSSPSSTDAPAAEIQSPH